MVVDLQNSSMDILVNRGVSVRYPSIIFALSVLLPVLAGVAATAMADNPPTGSGPQIRRHKITGAVYDEDTGEAISHVTVQVPGSGPATRTNKDGRFQLIVPPGNYRLKITHVGYHSEQFEITVADSSVTRDVRLKKSVYNLGEREVSMRAYDPAQRIIAEAIKRKTDILTRIHDYSFEASTRLVLADADKPDSESIFLIAESRTTSYWEQPDKYKEVITARRQSANISAEGNLVTVGQMLNFNRNRIDLGRYDVVSPTAHDAMDYYNYYLLDTVYIDDKPVFVLEVEPKNEYLPLFAGEIQIADSTFDVVKVDVGFSAGIQLPMIHRARYYQSMAQIENRYWLPVEIGISGEVVFDVPFPGIPNHMTFSHVASIYQYRIDTGHPRGTFGEYDIEVDEKADDIDSAAWLAHQMIPLTDLEQRGYERIDSLKDAPKPLYKKIIKGVALIPLAAAFGGYDIFHYNRVEGLYLGFGANIRKLTPNARLRLKTGYAFEDESWQYEFGAGYRLWEKRQLWVGGFYRDEIVHRPTVVSPPRFNSTLNALLFRLDPFDYHREKGAWGYFSFKPLNHFRLRMEYRDFRQSSKSKNTDWGVFRPSFIPRYNPPIVDGALRSIFAGINYDSRKLINSKGRELTMNASRYLRIEAGIEYASSDFIDNDFNFRRYYVRIRSRVRLAGFGSTDLFGYVGASDGELPPQRYFIADYHNPGFFKMTGMNTTDEANFGGDRIAQVYAVHDFGTNMFRNSGDKYLKKIPFGLTVHGGAMWGEFSRKPMLVDDSLRQAPAVYSEIGFGLNNLTPFLMPFNLSVDFTWQLSAYDTRKFAFMIDFKL